MGKVVAAKFELSGPPRRRRTLAERILVRFPAIYPILGTALARLRPGSRLRLTLVRRQLMSGWAAASRQDYELMLVRYHPDVEFEFDPDLQTLGLGGASRGREAFMKAIAEATEGWDWWEFHPACLFDLGDRLLTLGTQPVLGRASGVELEPQFAQLVTIAGGLVVREQDFLSWDAGLKAAGLEPHAAAAFHPNRDAAAQAAR